MAANFACVTAVYLAEFVMCGIRLGALAEYLLVLLFYRAPLSRMAQAVPLRKEL